MRYIGIDVGLGGAIGVLDEGGQFIAVNDMPIMAKHKSTGKVKNCIDGYALYEKLKVYAHCNDRLLTIEQVSAMPGQGVSSVFSLGDSLGSIRAVSVILEVPMQFVAPQTWKRHFKISKDKEVARALAINMFPGAREFLTRKKDVDRAEALLIARWAYETNKKGA